MRTAIEQKIEMLGLRSQLAELRFIDRPISDVIGDRASLLPAIIAAINDCFRQSDAQAVLLGGGPMVGAAREIAAQCDGPVIDGMEAAVEQLLGRIGAA
jgi:Asp/Glu/hydantoin racemase